MFVEEMRDILIFQFVTFNISYENLETIQIAARIQKRILAGRLETNNNKTAKFPLLPECEREKIDFPT